MMSNEQMHRTAPPRRGVDGGPIRRVITISLFLLLVVAAAVLAVEVEETTSSIKMSKSVHPEGSSNTSPSTYRKTAAQHQDQHVHTSSMPAKIQEESQATNTYRCNLSTEPFSYRKYNAYTSDNSTGIRKDCLLL